MRGETAMKPKAREYLNANPEMLCILNGPPTYLQAAMKKESHDPAPNLAC